MTITDEQLDKIGRLADAADNLIAASRLAVSPVIHVEGLRGGLVEIRAALREIYTEIANDNPWEDTADV